MMPDVESRLKKRPVPWDDLRERRVMARILDEMEDPARISYPGSSLGRYRYWTVSAIAASVIALAVGGWIFYHSDADRTAPAPAPIAQERPTLRLADVGEARLTGGAVVSIVKQDAKETTIAQSSGTVTYAIRKQRNRAVVVVAADVRIRVVGTRFTVGIEDQKVEVAVEEGIVSVNDGRQTVLLEAEETVSVSAKARVIDRGNEEVAETLAAGGRDDSVNNVPSESVDTKPNKNTAKRRNGARDTRVNRPETLMQSVDRLRREGVYDEAAATLRRIIAEHPGYADLATVWFTLGNVERRRGRHRAAALAYQRCVNIGSPLTEDALAESAISWLAAGEKANAQEAADAYLENYPKGPHRSRMTAVSKIP